LIASIDKNEFTRLSELKTYSEVVGVAGPPSGVTAASCVYCEREELSVGSVAPVVRASPV